MLVSWGSLFSFLTIALIVSLLVHDLALLNHECRPHIFSLLAMKLERAIEATITKMTETDRTESRSTHDMQAALESEMHAAMQSAATKTSDTIKQVMSDESSKLKVFVQHAQQDIEKDETSARDYAQQAQDKLSKVSTDVDNLGVMLQKNEIAAQTKSSDLLAEAAQLMRQQKELAAAAARATDEEREHIQKQAKELNAKLLAKVAQIEAARAEVTPLYEVSSPHVKSPTNAPAARPCQTLAAGIAR